MQELTSSPGSGSWVIKSPMATRKLPSRASEAGVLLLDSFLNPVASNRAAVQILTYPDRPENVRHLDSFLAGRIRSSLLTRRPSAASTFVTEFQSGSRRYLCRAFPLRSHAEPTPQSSVAVVLQRGSSGPGALSQVSQQFRLTPREREAVRLLLHGFANKEIAQRMAISPETVKVFIKLVMAKLRVTTRAAILAKIGASGLPDTPVMERNLSDSTPLCRISEQFQFTPRQRQAVELLLRGLTNKEIADRMAISLHTVKFLFRLVMHKLGVSSRAGIIARIIAVKTA
jgi:DNA-binding CsgD family transcriptional regulator